MRAGEAWWQGKADALDWAISKHSPACLNPEAIFKAAFTTTNRFKEGSGFKAKVMQDSADHFAYYSSWRLSMETQVAASECADRAVESIQRLKSTVDDFRSVVKNDLTSMKAASERVQNEVVQMTKAYKSAQDLLNSKEFSSAIENAERMAAALKAIQELTETKVSVAVFSGGKAIN